MKRIEANDPTAVSQMGLDRYDEGDYNAAFEYCTKAAELGDAAAHYLLSCLYDEGKGVEKDVKKKDYHLEEAAIGGPAANSETQSWMYGVGKQPARKGVKALDHRRQTWF